MKDNIMKKLLTSITIACLLVLSFGTVEAGWFSDAKEKLQFGKGGRIAPDHTFPSFNYEGAKQKFQDFKDRSKRKFDDAKRKLVEEGKDKIDDAKRKGKRLVEEGKDKIDELKEKGKDKFETAKEKAEDWKTQLGRRNVYDQRKKEYTKSKKVEGTNIVLPIPFATAQIIEEINEKEFHFSARIVYEEWLSTDGVISYLKENQQYADLSSIKEGRDWFIIETNTTFSGYSLYQHVKTIPGDTNNYICVLHFEYPAAKRKQYKTRAVSIANSFTCK